MAGTPLSADVGSIVIPFSTSESAQVPPVKSGVCVTRELTNQPTTQPSQYTGNDGFASFPLMAAFMHDDAPDLALRFHTDGQCAAAVKPQPHCGLPTLGPVPQQLSRHL